MPALLDGGAGDDLLRAGGGAALLLGGEGDDTLDGGDGADVRIGGLGADQLYGRDPLNKGSDSDLLIAGTTAYDAALRQVVAEWTSARSYAERTARLSSGADGLPRLDATTVFADGAADVLFGGGGLDWFFAEPGPGSTDLRSGERLN